MIVTYGLLKDCFNKMEENKSYFLQALHALIGEPDEILSLRCILDVVPKSHDDEPVTARAISALCKILLVNQEKAPYFQEILNVYNQNGFPLLEVAKILQSANLLSPEHLDFCLKDSSRVIDYQSNLKTAFLTIIDTWSKCNPSLFTPANFSNLKQYYSIFDYQSGAIVFSLKDSQNDLDFVFAICQKHTDCHATRLALEHHFYVKYPHLKSASERIKSISDIFDDDKDTTPKLHQALGIKEKNKTKKVTFADASPIIAKSPLNKFVQDESVHSVDTNALSF